jgi:hypothetical protein
VKKAQGVRLGRPASIPEKLAKRIMRMRDKGMTLQAICDVLNAEQVPTARGGRAWWCLSRARAHARATASRRSWSARVSRCPGGPPATRCVGRGTRWRGEPPTSWRQMVNGLVDTLGHAT